MGIADLIRPGYNRTVRTVMPEKIGMYNGVSVRNPKFLDLSDTFPEYKNGTVSLVRSAVRSGDFVVEVGTGFGVCSVWAARNAGPDGRVLTHEGSAQQVEKARETLRLNAVEDRVDVEHALVGPAVNVYGEPGGADAVQLDSLPSCDVFVCDAEGAEADFVDDVAALDPREVVIETHGHRGAPTDDIVDSLEGQGFEVHQVISAMQNRTDKDNMAVHAIRRD